MDRKKLEFEFEVGEKEVGYLILNKSIFYIHNLIKPDTNLSVADDVVITLHVRREKDAKNKV